MAITRGSTVEFPNSDPFFHNVFSLSRGATFDLGTVSARRRAARESFTQPGLVKVYCHLHSHMSASIMVFDHPHFVVPQVDGSFVLADVPAGQYRLSAWHERIGESAKNIVVEAGTHGHASSSRCRWRRNERAKSPPRFVVRTTVATLVMVAGVLSRCSSASRSTRERASAMPCPDKLEAGQRMLSALEQRRARELTVQVGTLAENPTLKAAVDTYQAELGSANATFRREMVATIDRELEKLAARIGPDVLAVTDPAGEVLAVAGRRASDWPVQRARARTTIPARPTSQHQPASFSSPRRRSRCRIR